MFSYFGSKSKIIKKYPKPTYNTIVEPFAGSARYALEYWDRKVIITDTYEKVYRVWKYLQNATPRDILSLPNILPRQKLSEVFGYSQLSDEEKYLIGFCVNRGSRNTPKTYAGAFCNWNTDKTKLANSVYKIRHWDIRNVSYDQIENVPATWYIDPPYEKAGAIYPEKVRDYEKLSNWCLERCGQVIVCENDGASWLPFTQLVEFTGQVQKSKEVMWTNI